MDIFDEINSWTADELLSQFRLSVARDGKSYVCPICQNGTGDTGDGIKPRINSKGQVKWHCFKCDKDYSNFDLAAATLGYDSERELTESARALKERLGYSDKVIFSFSKAKQSSRPAAGSDSRSVVNVSEKKSASDKEPKNYAGFYKFCRENYDLKKFFDEQGGSYRGLKAATFEKYGVVVNPEFGVEGHEKRPHLIIPYDDYHFVARAIEGHDRSQHGQASPLYEPLPINTELANFIVEGEIDCLSVAQEIGNLGFSCVATGGASKWRKVVAELEKRFGNVAKKPSFVVMFDNDEAGKVNGLKLVAALREAGYPAILFFLEGEMAGKYQREDGTEYEVPKVDANDILRQGDGKLGKRLLSSYDDLYSKLQTQAAQIAASKEQKRLAIENVSGIKISRISDYFASKFFSDIEQTSRYSGRKTGFVNIDANQIFMPGLYVIGALPACGKTTFCWQMLNQLANSGEPCVYCSFEMSEVELCTKSVSRELFKELQAGRPVNALTSTDIRSGKIDDNVRRLAGQIVNSSIPLYVVEPSNMSVVGLIEKLKPFVADADKSPVICLDYLQIIPNRNSKTAKDKIDDIALRLKDFQRETNSTLIVISSFNRLNYWHPVSFEAFKESGAIEYSADVIWGLENYGVDAKGVYDKDEVIKTSKQSVRKIKFNCLKNRNGGQYETFFTYYAAHDYFEPLEENETRSETICED